jgi:hypothetical protein
MLCDNTDNVPGGGNDDEELNVVSPEIHTIYGQELWRAKRAVPVRQNQLAYIQMAMRNSQGSNVDLQPYGFCNNDPNSPEGSESSESCSPGTNVMLVRFREASLICKDIYEAIPTIYDAENGIVKVKIPDETVAETGIYLAEFGVVDETERLLWSNECYVYVEHSAWHDKVTGILSGPPTEDDVRLGIRDYDPALNELLDNYDYLLGEIAYAATRVVQYWNDQPPQIGNAIFSTITYPFREIWTQGTQLFLFQMIEEYYRRNMFQVNSGGVVTDDKNKWREYNAAWKDRYAQWQEKVLWQKAQINLRRGWQYHGSPYPH